MQSNEMEVQKAVLKMNTERRRRIYEQWLL
jgi:hypothetical protein